MGAGDVCFHDEKGSEVCQMACPCQRALFVADRRVRVTCAAFNDDSEQDLVEESDRDTPAPIIA